MTEILRKSYNSQCKEKCVNCGPPLHATLGNLLVRLDISLSSYNCRLMPLRYLHFSDG